jgi:hypothetical protein
MRNDKRKEVRRLMQHTAWIAQKDQPLIGCVLSDVSEHGARLDVESIESIPDEFMLFLSRRGMPRRKCRVAWRLDDQGQLGVKFEEPPASPKGRGNPKVKAMIAARQASLQPDLPDAGETADTPAGKDEKESA